MKITKRQLRRIIREEILKEASSQPPRDEVLYLKGYRDAKIHPLSGGGEDQRSHISRHPDYKAGYEKGRAEHYDERGRVHTPLLATPGPMAKTPFERLQQDDRQKKIGAMERAKITKVPE